VEVHRFRLQETALALVETTGIPFATTILGKSVLGEQHPLYLGVYEGAMGREDVREYVESSDCVLMLGAFMTDINLGIYTAQLDPARCISVTSERLSIKYHHFDQVRFDDFLRCLLSAKIHRRRPVEIQPPKNAKPFTPDADKPVTVARLYQRLNHYLADETIVVADVGDAMFGAADLQIHRRTEFLGPAYYASMGFAIPAAIGAEIADRALRPLVLVGDGAFQMTGTELATAVRNGLRPIVLVLNNAGYGTERHMQDGPYNDVLVWNYAKIPELLGAGAGWVVHTEGELETALTQAAANMESFSIIDIHLAMLDRSPALERLAQRLAKRLTGTPQT